MLLIDGYNLLFKAWRGKSSSKALAAQRDALVERIRTYCLTSGQVARIYFDPRKIRPFTTLTGHQRRPPVEVIYLGDVSADQAILERVRASGDRTEYRVITSDREVSAAAAKRRFQTTEAAEFLAEMDRAVKPSSSASRPKTEGISEDEVDFWMKEFGLGGEPKDSHDA
ncbi:MAG: NYN domain-containing protein [Planctomycetes bacterium]|nr:NYN domain-containing protein [Planctomycetota bacterium]